VIRCEPEEPICSRVNGTPGVSIMSMYLWRPLRSLPNPGRIRGNLLAERSTRYIIGKRVK